MLQKYILTALFLFCVGRAFAQVTVVVDMKQTGPLSPPTLDVESRVRRNGNALYSATADYNGKPTLHAEEEIQNTVWTYEVSAGTGVIYSPVGKKTGKSAAVSAKSADAGTYTITTTFELTFTIKTPEKDSAGKYKYNADGSQKFTTRTETYSGSGSATLNVRDGKFGIKLRPSPTHEFPFRSYTRFGVGETGTIVVEKENETDPYTPVFEKAESSSPNDFALNNNGVGPEYTAGVKNGSSVIKVWAKINGVVEGPETIGVTVLQPQTIKFIKINENVKIDGTTFGPNEVGTMFRAMVRILPSDVSFVDIIIGEEGCGPTAPTPTGAFKTLLGTGIENHTPWSHTIPQNFANPLNGNKVEASNNSIDGCFAGYDTAGWAIPLASASSSGEFIWDIQWIYRVGNHKGNIAVIRQRDILDVINIIPPTKYYCEEHKNGIKSVRIVF